MTRELPKTNFIPIKVGPAKWYMYSFTQGGFMNHMYTEDKVTCFNPVLENYYKKFEKARAPYLVSPTPALVEPWEDEL